MIADDVLLRRTVVAFDPSLMVPALAMAGALLLGALIVACVRRWQRGENSLSPSASDQLAKFRTLYEQGAISEEEFKRLRTVLSGEIRREHELPRPSTPEQQAITNQKLPRAENAPAVPVRPVEGDRPS